MPFAKETETIMMCIYCNGYRRKNGIGDLTHFISR